ncbi:MAG: ferrochelatase [Hyphomicrobiales bacterium]|nr:ferrochelatase [Hyphomicrobiales bacterium]
MTRTAVVLFNLGGPDAPESVQPFLFNLFNDPAIIGLPGPLRWLVARLISRRRAPVAREIYANLGGKSPLLDLTREQATALEEALNGDGGDEYRAFIAMRYWHPMTLEAAERVRDWDPERVVLLPLYPQFSTTTTGSSLREWHRAADAVGLDRPTGVVCCYPRNSGLVDAQAKLIRAALAQAGPGARVLFSAHGLPKKVVDGGDPYQAQVEMTAAAVVEALALENLDWTICYQSRVGPLEWIGPSTEAEIGRAGAEKVPVVVVPIAFVSEHSETLVELDIEYRELAAEKGVPAYHRVPAVGTHPAFIAGLAGLVRGAGPGLAAEGGTRICPAAHGRCAMAA